ncbi:MAG: flagellar hook capping FlgD N-terminal domain-containing protein [Eubacteriales bacterium]
MSTISSVDSTYTSTNNNTITSTVNKELGQDEFLKLLTEQLKNQDPMSPMDDTDFIAQMAQFSSLEQMNNVADSLDELKNICSQMYSQSLLSQGIAMIGKEVAGIDGDGIAVNGEVKATKCVDDILKVQVGENWLNMEDISEVREITEIEDIADEEAVDLPDSEDLSENNTTEV